MGYRSGCHSFSCRAPGKLLEVSELFGTRRNVASLNYPPARISARHSIHSDTLSLHPLHASTKSCASISLRCPESPPMLLGANWLSSVSLERAFGFESARVWIDRRTSRRPLLLQMTYFSLGGVDCSRTEGVDATTPGFV